MKEELQKLININDVNAEIQKMLSSKSKADDEPCKPGFDLLTIEHIKYLN